MSEWFNELCGAAYMPHGQCYLWEPGMVWLHAVSDSLIALAYFSIPLALIYFVRRRRDVPFPGVFVMFGAFIVACGTTHLVDVWTIWQPHYWLSGSIKLITAVISISTAVALLKVMPTALTLPSPEDLKRLNLELDQRVRERTSELSSANERLENEIRQRADAEASVRALNTALNRRLEELQALFDLIPIGIAISEDPACRVVRSNRRLSELLGTPTDENVSLGRLAPAPAALPFTVWRGDRQLAPEELPMQLAAATNGVVTDFEETLRRADGSQLELVVNAVPLRDENGRARGCVATFADVTRLRAEEKNRLELERRMFESQRLEGLGVLAGGVAHDFNNILTSILGNTSIARQQLTPTQHGCREALVNAERASLRAAELCKQLLAYAGKGRFVIQPLQLGVLVEETAHLLELSVGRRITLLRQTSAAVPTFEGDATQIRQVLMNLTLNAAEAIGENAGVITITTGRALVTPEYLHRLAIQDKLEPGEYVTLEIADNGCGMKPEVLARIFDPFFTTKFTGRGLGLAAVMGILRGHKAGIKIYSEPGKGTMFKLLFPASARGAGSETPTRGITPGSSWRGHGCILVIDDDEAVRMVATLSLQHAGFEVETAVDGEEGVARVRAEPDRFRAVLLDLMMPRLDGEGTLRELRLINAALPIVMTSGFNEQITVNRFVGRGLAGFLQKPFTYESLLEKIRTALETPPATG